MPTDEERQNALAYTYEAAQMIHQLRTLQNELTGLLESGVRDAAAHGVSQAIIRDAVNLSPGRVSQIVNGGTIARGWKDRVNEIREWPGDALGRVTDFPGRMTFPPYPRRRER